MAAKAYYREEHPLVFVIQHWINLVGVAFLTLSGLYIHYPPFGGLMGFAQGAHQFWALVVIVNLLVRIMLTFAIKDANMPGSRQVELDLKNWLPQEANRHQLWPTIKYYLVLKKEHPLSAKYGPVQKLAYLSTVPMLLIAAYTGLCLWSPTATLGFFSAGTALVGGAVNMRLVHFFVMVAVVCFVLVHVYMVLITAAKPLLKLMLFRQETVSGGK